MNAPRWSLSTPAHAVGAVAVFTIVGDARQVWIRLGVRAVDVGDVRVRNLLGIDHGLIARPAEDVLLLTPHGGPGVVRALSEALPRAGLERESAPDPRTLYPEARSEVDAKALHALSRARSPLAVDLLLSQHDRWLAAGVGSDPRADALLHRLIDPPLVVALGPPNIGKSTLLNALAKRSVAITADEEGTTRDHVGALIDMNGLVVQYVDTPGMRDSASVHAHDPVLAEAQRLAIRVAERADLLLLCCDATRSPIPPPGACSTTPSLRVALRADLGSPLQPVDIAVSAISGGGLERLVSRVRETLLPRDVLTSPMPWKFWS